MIELEELYNQQITSWPLLAKNVTQLKNLKTRTLRKTPWPIIVQYNPARKKSVTASIKKEDIQKRACFLCIKNRPEEQKAVTFNGYEILCNPYPIFAHHFTISSLEHRVQSLEKSYPDMISMSQIVGDEYTLFFNGASAGASAPDHLHFQATPTTHLPMVDWVVQMEGSIIKNSKTTTTSNQDQSSSSFKIKKSTSVKQATVSLKESLQSLTKNQLEQGLYNVYATFKDDIYTTIVRARSAHRASCCGEEGFLISPASVELSGVIVTVRESDFNQISLEDIQAIYQEVC